MRLDWERRVVVSPRPLRKFIGHESARLLKSWSHELRGSVPQRSIIPFVVEEPYKGEDLGTGLLTTIFGAFGLIVARRLVRLSGVIR